MAPIIAITASDVDFLNFMRDPWRHVNSELHSKINWFNAMVVMYTENPKVLEEFDELPYGKKVCFVPFETDIQSGYYIKPYYVGGRPFEQAFHKIADGQIYCFDIWDMLLFGKRTPINLANNARGKNIMPSPCTRIKSDGRVKFFNWNPKAKYGLEDYFAKFVELNVPGDKEFNFFSLYGDNRLVRAMQVKHKILFSGEEIFNWPWYDGYQDYCLGSVDLALGSDYIDAPNYLHFPCWLVTSFKPTLDRKEIEAQIAAINIARNTGKYECANINSHDMMNIRTPIYNQLKETLDIKCAGKWEHNTDELQTVYGDDKMRYVHEFKFNMCPENTNRFGYVTEKIFDAFCTGSIPIYYGSDNRPEPGIINPSAVLFFDPKSDNQELIKEIRRLNTDDAYYDKFMRQEKLFAKPAADYIQGTLEELARRLREME